MAEIPTEDWDWINAAADRFERAWETGPRPRIEDFLADAAVSGRPLLLEELLRVERELRCTAREEPTPEEYRRRFPEHAAVVDAVFGEQMPPTTRLVATELPSIAADRPIGGTVSLGSERLPDLATSRRRRDRGRL